ncbi:hypothetical protein [Mycolicibacterium fortuitum]|uniref:hypothetical protein n=1 Tax=Mycolicibacterium fortuitum TaxID=1766 RepID=UPI000B22CD0D|nr:hypothetical protein [Mycolicibacterium fortuitum]
MTDLNHDETPERTWTPSPNTHPVTLGDPFGHYSSGEQPEPFIVTTGDPDGPDI